MRNFLFYFLIFALLCGCATTRSNLQSELQSQASMVSAKYPDQQVYMIYVEAPKSFITTQLIIASLKSGVNSNDVEAIKAVLINKRDVLLAVFGNNDGLAAATLERALISGGKQPVGAKVVFVGDENQSSLLEAAASVGITIDFMAKRN